MLNHLLEEARLDCKLCNIDRGYKCGADIGIVIGFNDDVVCIKKYTRDGLYDGLKLFTKSDIETVHFNGSDLHSISTFIQNHGAHLKKVEIDISGFDEFVDSACRKYGYVSLNNDSNNTRFIGPVLKHDDDFVYIRNHEGPSNRDRQNVLVAKWTIDSLSVDSVQQQNLMSLFPKALRV